MRAGTASRLAGRQFGDRAGCIAGRGPAAPGSWAGWWHASCFLRQGVGQDDDRGRDLLARCRAAGLIEPGPSDVTVAEFYFRTLQAYGGSSCFEPMIEEASRGRYQYAGVRCIRGEDGMFYWCVTLCGVRHARAFADGPSSGAGSAAGPPGSDSPPRDRPRSGPMKPGFSRG